MSFNTIAQKSNAGISNARDYLDNKANTLLKPKTSEGISGFLFDVPEQETLTLSASITDHYTENNSFLNDHITHKPIMITLTGLVGELVFESPSGVAGFLEAINNRLETVDAYLGDLTPGAVQTVQRVTQRVQGAVSAINQTLDKVQNVIGFFEGDGSEETLQQKAFKELKSLYDTRSFVTVQTPWEYYDNMVIQDIVVTQNAETQTVTDITVTLKELRVAETKTVDFSEDITPVREQVQSAPEEDQGIVRGQEQDSSLLFQIYSGAQ